MKCPFCDAPMERVDEAWVCPGGGRLLVGPGDCPFKGDAMTPEQIDAVIVALIDAEME